MVCVLTVTDFKYLRTWSQLATGDESKKQPLKLHALLNLLLTDIYVTLFGVAMSPSSFNYT